MADLAITAATVLSTGTVNRGTAGATITAGQAVYLDTASSTYKLAKADASTTAGIAGIALHGASASQPLAFHTQGPLNLGATLVVGQTYVLAADTAGAVAPVSDLATGNYVSSIGIATSASILNVNVLVTGIAHA